MTTKIPKRPRYIRSTAYALNALFIKNVDSFPINVQKECKSFGIKLKKYSTLAKKNNVTVDQIGEAYKTKLGYIYRNEKGKYFIAYNDTLPEGLIRFTLAHELGHFFLNHLEDFEETELMYNSLVPYSNEHECLEREANCFARNFLSPSNIAKLVGDEIYSMQTIFGLTYRASTVRLNSLTLDNKNASEITRFNMSNKDKVLSYLSKINYKYSNLHRCDNCNGEFSVENAKHCVFCGNTDLWKITLASIPVFREFGGIKVEYTRIETNESGTPVKCPKCEYEYLEDDFNYCPICAIYLHNVCLGPDWNKTVETYDGDMDLTIKERNEHNSSCKGNLDGAFRYCPECGSETSYGYQQILTNWKKEANTPFQQSRFNESPF